MAYDKEKIYNQAIKAIEDKNLFFIEHLLVFLPCDKTTFYRFYPIGSKEFETLKTKLNLNITKEKVARDKISKNIIKKYNTDGYVYIVQCIGFNYYKIGISKNDYHNRISSMQTGCPFELNMINAFHCVNYSEIEINLHKKYSKKRISGEWFELDENDLLDIYKFIGNNTKTQLTLF